MDYNQQRRGMQNNGCRQQNANCRPGANPGGQYQGSMGSRSGCANAQSGRPGSRPGYANAQNGRPGSRPGYANAQNGRPGSRPGYANAQNGCSGSGQEQSRPIPASSCPCGEETASSRPAPMPCPCEPCSSASREEERCPEKEEKEKRETCSLSDFALAMAYIRWQKWGPVYEPCDALSAGTLFPCLNMPFCAGRCR